MFWWRQERSRREALVASKSVLDSVIDAEPETFLAFSAALKEKCRKRLTFPLPPGDGLSRRVFARKKAGVLPLMELR